MAGTANLVLIKGPVASGKTTLAFRLAESARARSVTAAALDMDGFVEMVAGSDWSHVTQEHRLLAAELAGVAAEYLFATGVSLVSVAGSTVSAWEWEALLRHIVSCPRRLEVLLEVSVETAILRAQADPSRVATRNPVTVRELFQNIDWQTVALADLVINTDVLSPGEVLEEVLQAVFVTP